MSNPNLPEVSKATQFTSENQPANNGRKKNLFNYLKEDYHLSQSDLENIINNIASMSLEQYKELQIKIKNRDESIKDMPVIYIKLFDAFSKAKIDDILKLMRATGKGIEKQQVGIDPNDNKLEVIIKRI